MMRSIIVGCLVTDIPDIQSSICFVLFFKKATVDGGGAD